ncbi:DUF2950 family protein [Chitinilyticum litopenaei]|uniref:DUF2950 family protein n=1 Tax=Chitinilyticum litopenaei TaxID=1121276 RepID=UPI000404BDA4|nr:DUF2950 family protein [Chitinilyticum litopenaei]
MKITTSVLCACALSITLPAWAAQRFATPDEAGAALISALERADRTAVKRVLGKDFGQLINLGNEDEARARVETFVARYREAHAWQEAGPQRRVLEVGTDPLPFAIPLSLKQGKWEFDLNAGREEMLSRQIGSNELATIEVLREIQQAQSEYFRSNPDRHAFAHYAGQINSSPGTRDGLYWQAGDHGPDSPLGPLLAQAEREMRGKSGTPQPFNGYFYRLLDRQGNAAPGGAYSYRVNGKLLGGYALVSWPAHYGKSGVMTFITSHDGRIYQRNLGATTATAARQIREFNPTADWQALE